MNLRRLVVFLAAFGLLCACSRGIEPGLYTVQDGFVRIYVDSLGITRALMYRDTSSIWADTVSIDLKLEKPELTPYVVPEFRRTGSCIRSQRTGWGRRRMSCTGASSGTAGKRRMTGWT